MNATDTSALQSALQSPAPTSSTRTVSTVSAQVKNDLPIPVVVKHVDTNGRYDSAFPLSTTAASSTTSLPSTDRDYYVVFTKDTGAYVTTIQVGVTPFDSTSVPGVQLYRIGLANLNKPGDIGPLPQPTSDILIPADSQHVLVGCGKFNDSGSIYLLREQYWKRQSDSYSLFKGETRTFSMTTVQGLQSTSSSETSLSSTVGFNTSLGWGAFSASISASLSSTSTSFQQVVLTEQTTTVVSSTLTNSSNADKTYFRWQLTEVITFVKDSKPVGVLISGSTPVMISIH